MPYPNTDYKDATNLTVSVFFNIQWGNEEKIMEKKHEMMSLEDSEQLNHEDLFLHHIPHRDWDRCDDASAVPAQKTSFCLSAVRSPPDSSFHAFFP